MAKSKKITIHELARMKRDGERITMVTAYDATFAKLAEQGGAEVLLVGDSVGMVVQGKENTLEVTVDDIIYHARAVARGARKAHIVADMPFMSYQGELAQALGNAGRLIKEGRAHGVKLEGGAEYVSLIERLVRAGIPVMGHLGLTPQSVHALGGFRVQGKTRFQARNIVRDARALEAAGVYALVLEGVPIELSREVTRQLSIPTIGIGAGAECDGQVLVLYDLLGLFSDFVPRFVKRYEELGPRTVEAITRYREEVRAGAFPGEAHTFHADEELFAPRLEVVPEAREVDDDDGVEGLYGIPV